MAYVDGFVLAVPKNKLEEYRTFSERAGKLWKEFGALSYRECVADDVKPGKLTSFPQSVQLRDDEVVVFAYITYPSRAVRDAVNEKVMTDPRMKDMGPDFMPFDGQRMIFGGFEVFIDL